MTVVALLHHPTTPCPDVQSITVEVSKINRSSLHFCYRLTAELVSIRFPQPTKHSRRDELWRHTCFEAFVSLPGVTQYSEFNFSPSTEWAVYNFDDYREGMRQAPFSPPNINMTSSKDLFELSAEIDLETLGSVAPDRELQLGLSAVIERIDGQMSYWAIKHPMPKPDFHHRDGFALVLSEKSS